MELTRKAITTVLIRPVTDTIQTAAITILVTRRQASMAIRTTEIATDIVIIMTTTTIIGMAIRQAATIGHGTTTTIAIRRKFIQPHIMIEVAVTITTTPHLGRSCE